MKPQYLPLISQIYADETQKPKTTLTSSICLSLRYNAACCIPLRDLRNLRENIHMRVLNQSANKKPQKSPADLADLRRQTTKHQNIKPHELTRTHSISIKQVSKCRISDIQSLNLDLSV